MHTVWSVSAQNTPSVAQLSIAPTKKIYFSKGQYFTIDQAIGQKLEMPAQTSHGSC